MEIQGIIKNSIMGQFVSNLNAGTERRFKNKTPFLGVQKGGNRRRSSRRGNNVAQKEISPIYLLGGIQSNQRKEDRNL